MHERRCRHSRRGQALVELAISLPVLVILVAGVLEMGRGYAFGVATSDAARDAARYVAGKTSTTNGPGLTAMCSLITSDLASTTSNISCPTQVNHAPPFVAGTDYTKPVAGQAGVARYRGTSVDCTGSVSNRQHFVGDGHVVLRVLDPKHRGACVTMPGAARSPPSCCTQT